MKAPDFPQDEPVRLRSLRSLCVLDTAPEERFDRLTRLARRLFDVPIALVSLVDEDRQWFKSRQGLETTETSRAVSFCGHAIFESKPLVVEDATQDKRFADNPLVTDEPYIRFYAGCPLSFVDGTLLGTLCIIDTQPRAFPAEDLEALLDLANLVERELIATQVATLDELTHIANRRGFMALAQSALHFCQRNTLPGVLVFIDLDKFKWINDQFGHAEGDWALCCFAELIGTQFRDSDVYGRLGGDEFAVLMTGIQYAAAEKKIKHFCQALTLQNQQAQRGYNLAFSYGLVEVEPNKSLAIEPLLEQADARMYACKRQRTLEAN